MPSIINTADGGTNGTTPTTTNTGGGASGDAASVVTLGSGNTVIFSNEKPVHGVLGYKMTFGTSSAANIHWSIAEAGRVVHSFYVELSSLPTSIDYLGGVRHSAGHMCVITIGSDGKLILQDATGAGISASRATNTFPINQPVRVEVAVKKGTTTSNGTLEYAYYLGDSTTAEMTWSSNTQNTGTANVARVTVGRNTSSAQARTMWFDTIRAQTLASGWIGPYSQAPGSAIINTAEGGAPGLVPTTANTGGGSGDAASSVTVGTGNAIQFTDSTAAHGGLSYVFDYGTTAGGNMRWSIAESGRLVHSFYVELSSLPSAADYLGGVRNATGHMCIAAIGSDGKFIMQNAAAAGISASRATLTFPVGQKVRVEIAVTKGTTTTDGTIEYAYYLGDSSTAEMTWSSNAQNTGTTDVAFVAIGRNTVGTQARTMWYDTIRAQSKASGWIGPFAAPSRTPTAVLAAGITDVEPFSTQVVDGSKSLAYDGRTIVEYTFRQISGSPTVTLSGTGDIVVYEAPGTLAGTTLVFGMTATDDNGSMSDEDTVSHTILPATERAVIDGAEVPLKVSSIINGE